VEQKDYTGLKIKQLTITDEEQNKANLGYENDGNDRQDDDGQMTEGGEKDGPWKKMNAKAPVVKPKAAPAPKVDEKQKYVMPAMRVQVRHTLLDVHYVANF
jgi:Carnitine deficiency-associated protein 3